MERLLIDDKVYGCNEVTEPIKLDLIKSQPVQRLKAIKQYGLTSEFQPDNKAFTRYDHSLGVMNLLDSLNAPLEVQIVGLLHDISHTAFSHLIDQVLNTQGYGSRHDNFQDENLVNFICGKELSEILRDYGFDPERIAQPKNFPLVDKNLPDLCADRVDYTLREMDSNHSGKIYQKLTVEDDQIACGNYSSAAKFARAYLNHPWTSPDQNIRQHYFAQACKIAMENGDLTMDDFWGNDESLAERLKESQIPNVRKILKALRKPILKLDRSKGVRNYGKPRTVDPLFKNRVGKLVRLSDVDVEYRELRSWHIKLKNEGNFIPALAGVN